MARAAIVIWVIVMAVPVAVMVMPSPVPTRDRADGQEQAGSNNCDQFRFHRTSLPSPWTQASPALCESPANFDWPGRCSFGTARWRFAKTRSASVHSPAAGLPARAHTGPSLPSSLFQHQRHDHARDESQRQAHRPARLNDAPADRTVIPRLPRIETRGAEATVKDIGCHGPPTIHLMK